VTTQGSANNKSYEGYTIHQAPKKTPSAPRTYLFLDPEAARKIGKSLRPLHLKEWNKLKQSDTPDGAGAPVTARAQANNRYLRRLVEAYDTLDSRGTRRVRGVDPQALPLTWLRDVALRQTENCTTEDEEAGKTSATGKVIVMTVNPKAGRKKPTLVDERDVKGGGEIVSLLLPWMDKYRGAAA
jgi:hypothetical protein